MLDDYYEYEKENIMLLVIYDTTVACGDGEGEFLVVKSGEVLGDASMDSDGWIRAIREKDHRPVHFHQKRIDEGKIELLKGKLVPNPE